MINGIGTGNRNRHAAVVEPGAAVVVAENVMQVVVGGRVGGATPSPGGMQAAAAVIVQAVEIGAYVGCQAVDQLAQLLPLSHVAVVFIQIGVTIAADAVAQQQ